MRGRGLIVHRWSGSTDAIHEYSDTLCRQLRYDGVDVGYSPDGLAPAFDPAVDWVLLQYNPFRWGRSGIAPALLGEVRRLGKPMAVMVHEAWIERSDPKSALIGTWQRMQLRRLLRHAGPVAASTEAVALSLGAIHLPVATNVSPVAISSEAARRRLSIGDRLVVGLFGRDHPSRALDHAAVALAALADAHGPERLLVLNLGQDAPAVSVPAGVRVEHPRRWLPSAEISVRLWACDLILLPLVDGVSTKRGTLMAALAHGRPVVGLRGASTDRILAEHSDALILCPVGDRAAFARATVELAGDPVRRRQVGDGGRRLYAERFDWPVLAGRIAGMLSAADPDRLAGRAAA